MTTPSVPPQHGRPLEQRTPARRLAWWRPRSEALAALDPDRIPTVEQALEQDARTRWMMLVCLNGAEWVSLRFIETWTQRANAQERQRSLDWLLETGCITEQQHADRAFFWQQRREWRSYAITPIGSALFARITARATAEQLGIQGETPDLPKMVLPRWWRVTHGIIYVVLVALAVELLVSLLGQVFR